MTAARTSIWFGAALLVIGGHAAAAVWAMHARPDPLPALGEPIFIDMAPPPAAPSFAVPDSGLDLSGPPTFPDEAPPEVTAPPVPFNPLPPLTVFRVSEPAPPIELPPLQPLPPLDAEALLPPPEVAAARPVPRPARLAEPAAKPAPEPKRKEPEKRGAAPKSQPASASPSRADAGSAAKASRRAGQAGGAAASATPQAQATWRSKASAAVARHMQRGRYSTRQPVSATIRLTVDGAGRVTSAQASSGGAVALDQALNRQIRRLGRLPAPPGGKGLSVVVPVRVAR